jgi:hypothetical protein
LKIKSDSISWFESGKLHAHRRSEAGASLLKKVVLLTLVGVVAATGLNFYVSHKFEQPLVTTDSVLIWSLAAIVPGLIVVIRGLFGRSIALTNKCRVLVQPGSRLPNRISYEAIDHCELRKIIVSGESVDVLDVFGRSEKIGEVELPGNGETSTLIEFLEARNVLVRRAS